jgi:hypothetical protein
MIGTMQAVSVAAVKTLTNATSLLSRFQQFVAQTRADKERVDAELFRGRYHLSSKNDDDLPLAR